MRSLSSFMFSLAFVALASPAVAAVHLCNAPHVADAPAAESAAAAGDASAECAVGILAESGDRVAYDPERARTLFEAAADQGAGCGDNGLGRLYFLGIGVPTDYAKAQEYFKVADARHYRMASFNVGQTYYYQPSPDYAKAFAWYLVSATKGCAEGAAQVGDAYEFGTGTSADADKAELYLTEAAHAGVQEAAVDLGTLYLENHRVHDYAKALKWLYSASDFDLAKFQLGRMFYFGYGVTIDKAEAYRWFLGSAEQHYGPAEIAVGRMLSTGDGTDRNRRAAAGWLERAAMQGEPSAFFALGEAYADGRPGDPPDPTTAVRYYEMGASRGDMLSLTSLALFYHYGWNGIQIDLVKAYAYASLAGRINPPDADQAAKIRPTLSSEQLAEANAIIARIPKVQNNIPPPIPVLY